MSLKVTPGSDCLNAGHYQRMLDDVVTNADYFSKSWSREFAWSLAEKRWEQLSEKQQTKVIELWEDEL